MPNLKEIHSRIVSIGSTIQITSAMKMVSAAKLKRAQDAITQMRPYANKLHELLINLSSALDSNEGKYSQERKIKKVLLVSISSNRGLCGGFNANVIKKTIEAYEKYEGNEVDILTIGKKTSDFFTKNDYNLVNSYDEVFADLTFENTSKISEKIMEEFVNEKYDKVEIIYNQFKNAATQILINEQLQKKRLTVLQNLLSDIQIKENSNQVGKLKKVLIENKMKNQTSYFGRLENFTPVIIEKVSNSDIGKIINVRIDDFNKNNLFGIKENMEGVVAA